MKKVFILAIVMLVCITILSYIVVDATKETYKELRSNDNNIKSNIGKTIIINKDTLIITDYSMLNSNYTLSNGTKVSFEYINNLK